MDITVNIATLPDRYVQLINTVASLYFQADKINIALNNYKEIPKIFLKDKKINAVLSDNSFGDAHKFQFQEKNQLYFTCDDDLIYPPNYVKNMIEWLYKHDIVTIHGRSFNEFPIKSYYKSASRKYRCLTDENYYGSVQFGGTGVMAFNTNEIQIPMDIFTQPNMADVHLGCWAKLNNIEITHLPHCGLEYQPVENTIFDNHKNNDSIQTDLVNKIFC